MASQNGHKEVCRVLVNKGSDIDNQNEQGYTAVHLAVLKNHEEVCKYLIEKGANINL